MFSGTAWLVLCVSCTVILACWAIWRTMWSVPSLAADRSSLPSKAVIIRKKTDPYDVIIVGAGTAGAALAVTLGRQGRRVLVVERSLEIPDRIVGELLQPGGVASLRRMCLQSCVEADAASSVPIHGYVLVKPSPSGPIHVRLHYPAIEPSSPLEFCGFVAPGEEKGDGPKGRGYHNHRFVAALRDTLAQEPNVTLLEGRVTGVVSGEGDSTRVLGVKWVDKQGTAHTSLAPLSVLADGYYSLLRKHLSSETPVTASHFAGLLITHAVDASPVMHKQYGHVILAQPNPVLFYQISPTETRVLVDVPPEHCSIEDGALTAYFLNVIAPQLPFPEMRDAFLQAVKSQEATVMPNRALWAAPPAMKGAILLGDAWNTRHPLTGGGMTVCLRDVEILTRALAPLPSFNDQSTLECALSSFLAARKPHSSTTNILANALHGVFAVPQKDPGGVRALLQSACFEYLCSGGYRAAGPVSLLAGLAPRPLALTTHFFNVAILGVVRQLLPFPTPSRVRTAFHMLAAACGIIMPMIVAENVTVLAWAPIVYLTNALFRWRKEC